MNDELNNKVDDLIIDVYEGETKIKNASFWKRFTYLFTGRLK
jgi:hypothetical protein